MVTLAGVRGSDLVPGIGRILAETLEPIGLELQGRRKEADLQERIRIAFGGAPEAAPVKRRGPGRNILESLSPELAQAANQISQSRDRGAAAEFRTTAQTGLRLADEINKLPDFASKQRRLAQETAAVGARGEDTSRLNSLSNLSEPELDLELQKMSFVGKGMLDAVPEPQAESNILELFNRPASLEAFAAIQASNPQVANQLLQIRQRALAEQARQRAAAAAGARARAAAAAPKTELGKRKAAIQADIQTGAVTQEIGDELIAQAQARALAGGESPLDVAEQRADIEATRLSNQLAVQELTGTAPGAALDIEAAELDIAQTQLENQQLAQELADPASNLSPKEQQILRTMESQNVDRATAQGVVDGIITVRVNPVSGDPVIVNKVTQTSITPTDIGNELPSLLPDALIEQAGGAEDLVGDPSRAFGAQGLGINAINTIVDAIGLGTPAGATDEAIQAIDNLNTRFLLALSGEFPGRPSNLTRELILKMTATPASVFTGKDRALNKMKQSRALLAESIAGADQIQRGIGGTFSADDRGDAAKALIQLIPIWDDYETLVNKMEGKEVRANIVNQAEFNALAKGTKFKLPDGRTGTK